MIVDMIQNVDMILTEFFLKFFSSVGSFFDTGCGWISQMELLYALQSSLLISLMDGSIFDWALNASHI